jgi:hypothetical protein
VAQITALRGTASCHRKVRRNPLDTASRQSSWVDKSVLSRNIYNDAGACNDAETCLRVSSDKPRLKAFCRVAFSVRFKVRAIFAARVLLPASFFNVRTSWAVHGRLLFFTSLTFGYCAVLTI